MSTFTWKALQFEDQRTGEVEAIKIVGHTAKYMVFVSLIIFHVNKQWTTPL